MARPAPLPAPEFGTIYVTAVVGAPPRRGALASDSGSRLGIITGKMGETWVGVPVGLSPAVNEKYRAWRSKDPTVIGYLNIEDLS